VHLQRDEVLNEDFRGRPRARRQRVLDAPAGFGQLDRVGGGCLPA